MRPGRIQVRGPLNGWADGTSLSPLNMCGVQPTIAGGLIVMSRKVVNATAFVDPWNAPILRVASSGALANPNLSLVDITTAGAVSTSAVANGALVPGPRGITYNGNQYYISYGTSSSPVFDASHSYVAQNTSVGSVSMTGTTTEITSAPHGALDIKGYLQRIWLLGGVDTPGSGTTFSPTTLFFTNGPTKTLTASSDWKDPVSGLTNQIDMDFDNSDPGVALATVSNALIVFRYRSIWVLRGTTPASFVLQPFSNEVGCIDPRSVVETDAGVYFLSARGLMLTDGSTIQNVSGNATQTLQNAVGVYTAAVLDSVGGYATCAMTSEGQILVSIGAAATDISGAPTGGIRPTWCALFDPSINAWTRITSELFEEDGQQIVDGNNYPGPIFGLPDQRLFSVNDKIVTKFEDPALPVSATRDQGFSFVRNQALHDITIGGLPAVIPARWVSRLVPVTAATHRFGQLKRVYADYVFQTERRELTHGFDIHLRDATGMSYVSTPAPMALVALNTIADGSVSGGQPLAGVAIQRQSQDTASEISDVLIDVTWNGPQGIPAVDTLAELYGVAFEYQNTRVLK